MRFILLALLLSTTAYAGLADSPIGTIGVVPGDAKPDLGGLDSGLLGVAHDIVSPRDTAKTTVKVEGKTVVLRVSGVAGSVVLAPASGGKWTVTTGKGAANTRSVKPKGKGLRLLVGQSVKAHRTYQITVDKNDDIHLLASKK